MTVLITGGAGYIGGQTVLSFIDRGEIPVVLDDLQRVIGVQSHQTFRFILAMWETPS